MAASLRLISGAVMGIPKVQVVVQLKVDFHSFSGRETFGHSATAFNSLLTEFYLTSQIVVGTIRVMMK
jgi:hypothetical protein